ncbi:NfeD family protein [Hazenella coriacea]|uniref:Membrane protein implicated in regulation of membrane protease activity n=1 Tax=Hazenella coriacea TaxID=1179467 RepID=A0A4R3LBR1_9BACL|nr:NfeD family protein [Hazenella coriacea]TCS96738.1 membrane protein implicated in regulation of membrane protease activity [Hazenella coriacea]
MLTLFWICFLIGIGYVLLLVLVGEIFHGLFSFDLPMLQPVTIMGALTLFGASGIIASQIYQLTPINTLLIASGVAILSFILLYVLFVRTTETAENSTGFQYQDLIGKTAEVITPIPSDGYGEILLVTSGGRTAQIAASEDGSSIPQGTQVKVQKVQDQIFYVSSISS